MKWEDKNILPLEAGTVAGTPVSETKIPFCR
jgi:hypothetical protein